MTPTPPTPDKSEEGKRSLLESVLNFTLDEENGKLLFSARRQTTTTPESESGKLSARKGLCDNNFFKQTLNHPSSARAKAKNPPKYNIMITSYQAHMAAADLDTFLDGALVTSGLLDKISVFPPFFFFPLTLKRNLVAKRKREKDFHPIFTSTTPVNFFLVTENSIQ